MKYLWQNISIEHILCARILTNLKYSIGRAWIFSFKWVLLVSFILHYVNLISTSLITLPVSWRIIILKPTIFTFTPLPSAFSHTAWQASSGGTIAILTSPQSRSQSADLLEAGVFHLVKCICSGVQVMASKVLILLGFSIRLENVNILCSTSCFLIPILPNSRCSTQGHCQSETNKCCVICQQTASRQLRDSQLREFTKILTLQHPALFQHLLLACFLTILLRFMSISVLSACRWKIT